MSAPDTDTEKQKDRHKAPLRFGIALPIIAVVALFVVFVLVMFLRGEDPVGADAQVDGSGEVVDAPAVAPAAD